MDLTDASWYVEIAALDPTHFVATWTHSSPAAAKGTSRIGSVSGTDITWGSTYDFYTGTIDYTHVTALDSSNFAVVYSTSSQGEAVIGTVANGDEITYGSPVVFHSSYPEFNVVEALDTTHFVVAFREGVSFTDGHAVVGVVSGSNITFGSEYPFISSTTTNLDWSFMGDYVAKIDNTRFLISYSSATSSAPYDVGEVAVGELSNDDELTFTHGSFYPEGASYDTGVTYLDGDSFAVLYADWFNTDRSAVKIGELACP